MLKLGMSPDDRRRIRLWLAACGLAALFWILSQALPGKAQNTAQIQLGEIDQSDFPRLQTLFTIHDASGNFVSGLTAQELRLQEAGQALAVQSFSEQQPGAQFVLAVTYGPGMGVRDAMGVSRYETLLSRIAEWQNDWPEDARDNLSLVVDGGPEVTQRRDGRAWLQTFLAYQPEALRQRQPNIQILSRALEIAAAAPPRPGMGRGVLFITPILPDDTAAGLQNLALTAQSQGIRVHVWLVASFDAAAGNGAAPLKSLASLSGGHFYAFDENSALPALEEYLTPLRRVYSLAYDTPIRSSGSYTVSLSVERDGQIWQSTPRSWSRTILPPNPVFMSLPTVIERQAASQPAVTASAGTAALRQDLLTPQTYTVQMLVDFPDQDPRPLAHTALYVDGLLVAENTSEPFDQFTWDLSSYEKSGQHLLRVEASDSLGLTGSSIEFPVEIQTPGGGLDWQIEFSNQTLLAGGVVLLGLVVLAGLVLVMTGRIAPYRQHLKQQEALAKRASQGGAIQRPLPVSSLTGTPTQPSASGGVPTRPLSAPQRLPSWMSRLRRSPVTPGATAKIKAAPAASAAYLTPFSSAGNEDQGAPLSLSGVETIFGRDPAQASWALDDPALEAVHTRLVQEDGSLRYRVYDAGSVAGTWVNYSLVPPQGVLLQPGDALHVGRIGFRFHLREKTASRKPKIQPQEPSA